MLQPPSNEALKLCLKWLRAGELTEAELRQKLEAKKLPESEISSALDYVQRKKWQSDERVAERTKELGDLKLHGKAKIESRLKQRGLDDEVVSEILADIGEEDEMAKAEKLLSSRLKEGSTPAQAARILASRGFDEEVIRSVLESHFPDWESY